MREALFSVLGHDLSGTRALDLFAGSGALGLESLSRGADQATFVETDPTIVRVIRNNVAMLGIESRARVVSGAVETIVAPANDLGRFDLVMADPPYAAGPAATLLSSLNDAGVLAPGARIVYQRDSRTPVSEGPHGPIRWRRTARYGRTSLDFYDVGPDAG